MTVTPPADFESMELVRTYFPVLFQTTYGLQCPTGECISTSSTAGLLVTHLNDTHRWPRELIADALERMGL